MAVVIILMTMVSTSAQPSATNMEMIKTSTAPQVIPALTNWTPFEDTYHFNKHSRILIPSNDSTLWGTGQTLAKDLVDQYGQLISVVSDTQTARAGDVVLNIDPSRVNLSEEGYTMVVGDIVWITAATNDGVFYGTRTLLQLLTQDRNVPQGQTVDIPRYSERGLEMCACEVKISMPRIERLLKDMAYLKLNYLLLPMKVKSKSHPEINQWSYYTKDEARRIVKLAEKYHVMVIPEINAPGHMEPFLFDRPDLQLTDRDGNKSPGRLEIIKPEAFDFYTDLIDEYSKIFDSPYWFLGADEYIRSHAAYESYPQIGEYAREKFGPEAVPSDAFIDFINRVDEYVRNTHGKTLRIWNDGLPRRNVLPSEQAMNPHPRLNTEIIIEHWKPSYIKPSEFVDAGYTIMNSAGALYFNRGEKIPPLSPQCGDASTLETCVPQLWDSGWNPGRFEGGDTVGPNSPKLRGAHLSLWQGPDAAGETENQVQSQVFMPLRFIAQRTWGSVEPFVSYDMFVGRAKTLGHAPGWFNLNYRPLSDGTYTIRAATGGGSLTLRYPEAESELVVGNTSGQWQLHHTDDDYYRVVSSDTRLCLSMHLADNHQLLKSAPGVGDVPTMERCNGSNTQKWEITGNSRFGFTLTNALSQMVLTITEEDIVVQLPPDQAMDSQWKITKIKETDGN